MRKNDVTDVAWVTSPAVHVMAWSSHVERRFTMRVYLEVVATIIGLLGAFVALTYLVA